MSSDSKINPEELLSELAESYLSSVRIGNAPSIDELAQQYPELADEIRSVFPMLGVMEDVVDLTGSANQSRKNNRQFLHESLPSQTVLGEYRVLREIGRGGMGVVYEAEHTTLQRRVALKILPGHVSSSTLKERFHREARAAARLHHTNIVPVFDFGEDKDIPYYAMQCIDGRGLDQLVEWAREQNSDLSSGSLSGFWNGLAIDGKDGSNDNQRWHLIAQIGIQAAMALEYAHQRGVIHRDIKPSNLLLERSLHVWVTDFGLAKLTGDVDLTATGDVVGTLRYLPPEAMQGQGDRQSDIYGLGLVLYELASLRRPFDDSTRLSLVKQIIDVGPMPLRRLRPDLPLDLVTIIETSVDRDATSRYSSAAELAADLQRFIDDKPIKARSQTFIGLTWRWAKRNRLAATLITTVTMLLIAGFIISALFSLHLNGVVKQRDDALNLAGVERRIAADERDRALQKLFDSHVARAATLRTSGQMGQRIGVIQAVKDAVAMLPLIEVSPDTKFRLRSEYIGALAHGDVEFTRDLPIPAPRYEFDYNANIDSVLWVRPKDRSVVLTDAESGNVQFESSETTRPGWPTISPNGRWLSWTNLSDELIIADRLTGKECIRRQLTRDGYVSNVSFTLGNRAAWIEPGGIVVGVDLEDGNEFVRIQAHKRSRVVAISRNGKRIAAATPDRVHAITAWDVETSKPLLHFENRAVALRLSWNHRGDELAVAADFAVDVWNIDAGCRRLHLPHSSSVFHVAYSERGDVLFASTWGHTTRMWDVQTGERMLQLGGILGWGQIVGAKQRMVLHRGAKLSLCQLAARTEHKIMLPVDRSNENNSSRNPSIHPNGRFVAAATNTGVRLGDAVSGVEVAQLHTGYASNLEFVPDGSALLVATTRDLTRWPLIRDSDTGRVTGMGPPEFVTIPKVMSEQGFGTIVDASKTNLILRNRTHIWVLDMRSNISRLLDTDDNELLRAVGPNADPFVFRNHQNKIEVRYRSPLVGTTIIDKNTDLQTCTVSPDGTLLLVVGDHIFAAYALPGGQKLYENRNLEVARPVSISMDSRWAFLSSRNPPGTLVVDARAGIRLAQFPAPNATEPRNTASHFSQKSQRLVAFGRFNELVSWDCASVRRQLARLDLDWDDRPLPQLAEPSTDESNDVSFHVDWGPDRRKHMARLVAGKPYFINWKTIDLLTHLIEQDPSDIELRFLRAKAYRTLGEPELAIVDLQQVLEKNIEDQDAAKLLAEITAD